MEKSQKDNDIVVSFCIPSYNRGAITKATIASIIKYDKKDIEVVVVDNCSTDNTKNLIESIEDDRVRVIVNSRNLGAMGNYIESLKHAKGKYVFVVLSRDSIRTEKILPLVDYLRENNVALMYCGEDRIDKKHKVYEAGTKAFCKFAYGSRHQTGFVFRRKLMEIYVKNIPPESVYDRFGYLPHDFIAAHMSLMGRSVFYNNVIRNRVDERYMKTNKSACKEPKHELWFFPNECISQFLKYIDDLDSLDVDTKTYNKVFRRTYWRQLGAATVTYKENRGKEYYCMHYGIPVIKVTNKQMHKTYRNFHQLLSSYMKDKKRPISIASRLFVTISGILLFGKNLKSEIKILV